MDLHVEGAILSYVVLIDVVEELVMAIREAVPECDSLAREGSVYISIIKRIVNSI